MIINLPKAKSLKGILSPPADKSISHRALIFAALAKNEIIINNILEAEDCLTTLEALNKFGFKIGRLSTGRYLAKKLDNKIISEPQNIIDCKNSGTTMRLLAGLASSIAGLTILTGDDSLRNRPMQRIIDPLTKMGAEIFSRSDGLAPLAIRGGELQKNFYFSPQIASAQLKSAILLAVANGGMAVEINEPAVSRDHTERLLALAGENIKYGLGKIIYQKDQSDLYLPDLLEIPGDFSSAAYFIGLALILSKSEIIIKEVGINPTRTGLLEILDNMNAKIEILNRHQLGNEPVADLKINYSQLKGTVISGSVIPRMIDELPLLAVIAGFAEGKTIIKDAAELKVKETDRIEMLALELRKLGYQISTNWDGMTIYGRENIKPNEVRLDCYQDHRLAMALAVAGTALTKKIILKNADSVNISYPDFFRDLRNLAIF